MIYICNIVAFNFLQDFGCAETVFSKDINEDEEDQPSIVNLLTDQIEFANVILLNKTDLVSPEQADELKAILQKLNPKAKILYSYHGKIQPEAILNTGLFDAGELEGTEAWQDELQKEHTLKSTVFQVLFLGTEDHELNLFHEGKSFKDNWPF